MNKFNPELPCPHCNAPVKGTLIKGLAGVKQCPSCQKKIKYHKPALGAVFKDIWKPLAIFMVLFCLLTVVLFMFGVNMSEHTPFFGPILGVIFAYFVIVPVQVKHSYFEKDE
ncbi:hypothetical protein [Haemophilus sputorum]|uniref:hypothetical protein n=1 Tax=Haemophilus sputorum TaxID=1078480 RepID=UPI0028D71D31|nr:hypothetical protein [Haemophilus sputorum]